MQLILMRHGQTQGNLEKRYVGVTDEPLCEEGIACAKAAYHDEQLQRVYVSPLQRALQTAEICFPHAEQIAVEGLREMDFGVFEGKTYLEMAELDAYNEWVAGNCEGACPGGEDKASSQQRICSALMQLLDEANAAGEKHVVVVAHGGTIMAALDRYVQSERNYFDWHVDNCEGYVLNVEFEPELRFYSPEPLSVKGE